MKIPVRDDGTNGGGVSSWMEDMYWRIQKRLACQLGVRNEKKEKNQDYKVRGEVASSSGSFVNALL